MTTAVPLSPVLTGRGVGYGIAMAPSVVLAPAPAVPADEPVPTDLDQAEARIRSALTAVAAEFAAQATSASPVMADVLTATSAIAADSTLATEAVRHLRAGAGPATAVARAIEGFATTFTAAGGYLAERVTDLRSVGDRVTARLLGLPTPGLGPLTGPTVVVATDLAPADTAALDLDRVVAIVTEQGGPTGHTAIIARQLGLPCVVGVRGITAVPSGTLVLVDAGKGTVTTEPTTVQVAALARRTSADALLAKDTAPGATADGHPIALLANVGTPADAARAAATAVQGVGLFRTEVLFLDRHDAPSADEQVTAYRQVIDAMDGRKTVIRTLDAGADKPLAFVTQPAEENPALGVRGNRLLRIAPDVVTTQIDALGAVVSTLSDDRRSDVWVMAPMIATPAEAKEFATMARARGVATVGVMVEIPAAALRARDILAEVDFVSLGTNDLAQYTMATDRLRAELADLLDPWQPAVLELIAATARAGRDLGKPVGVCGESAADPLMALVLAGLGVTSLSMAPAAVPGVRYALRQHTLEQCRAMARAALDAPDPATAQHAVLDLADASVHATFDQ